MRDIKVVGIVSVFSYDDTEKSYVMAYKNPNGMVGLPYLHLSDYDEYLPAQTAEEFLTRYLSVVYGIDLDVTKWMHRKTDTNPKNKNRDVIIYYAYDDETYDPKFRTLSDFFDGLNDPRLQPKQGVDGKFVWVDITAEYDEVGNPIGYSHMDDYQWIDENDKKMIAVYA